MKGFFHLFKRSALELKSIRSLTAIAMLIAIDLVLKVSTGVMVTSYLQITFAFLAMASIGMLFGPTVGFIAGIITDLLGMIVHPTGAFDIRFTLIEALGGLIYGLFLYNAKNDRWMVPRIIAAKTSVVIFCNMFLTTLATSSLLGKGFLALLPTRAIKAIILLPVDIILLSLILPVVLKIWQMIPGVKRITDDKLLFADENMGKAMITLVAMVMAIVCSLGYAAQYLKDQQTDIKSTVTEQGEEIERISDELASIYDQLGLEPPTVSEETE